MKRKILISIPFTLLCCLFLSAQAYALSDSDIKLEVRSPIDSLVNESGVIAVEQFPAQITIHTAAKTGALTNVWLEYNGQNRQITEDYTLRIESKEACGPYTITAQTDEGAMLVITANVVFQVQAIYNVHYRTIGMNVNEISAGDKPIKSFTKPEFIDLINANTIAPYEQERIANWVDSHDGGTYILKGSLVVEIYNYSTGKLYGTYDTKTDFEALITHYGWTPETITAFETMGATALSYQAPVRIDINATWCDEQKRETYGQLSAQDKSLPELLFPYQTCEVTFHKDDIPLSRNYIYLGLEWDYEPESGEYTDGESKTLTSITQKIHYRIPTADFYFLFKPCDGNDLSVAIHAPTTVYRGDNYSFTVTFTNGGASPAFDVPLKGKVDNVLMDEIPSIQDFEANEGKTFTLERTADTVADVIHLWANIGIPAGFVDANPANNTATADIRVLDPAPEPKSDPGDNPDQPGNPDDPDHPNGPHNPPDEPPILPEFCDLSASILAPSTVYTHENYSFIVSFTNHFGKELKAVSLQGKNNDSMLSQIPKTANFKLGETKSFTITDVAGNEGEIYRLWVNIQEPTGIKDANPTNNIAVSNITVIGRHFDNPDNPDGPNNPEDPSNPENPDNPENKLCDLWANLSFPPSVYEQEEYSFTAHFTNSSNKELAEVKLSTTIDGAVVSIVPSTVNFQAHETKSFVVKGKAGVKGATIRLSARISPPDQYVDTNTSNNQAVAEIAVIERAYDLDVQRLTPSWYKENQTVVSTIKVSNRGSLDFTPGQQVSVQFDIPELSLSKRINTVVMERDTWNVVSVKWDTPNVLVDKDITLVSVINPDKTLGNENASANNTYTQKAVIKNVVYGVPEESKNIPVPSPRTDQPKVVWWEQRFEGGQFLWKQFYAELTVAADLDYDTKAQTFIKSGYGFSISVKATIKTNYDQPELITAAQTAEVYLPQYRYQTAIPLMVDSSSHFTFRENPESPYRYKKQYVPVWFPDNTDYIPQLLVTDIHTPGGTLSKWLTGGNLKIHVSGNMFDDDVTTGR